MDADDDESEDADGRWRAKPHTLAKHRILSFFLDGWFPILTFMAKRHEASGRKVTYVDAFAGPGQYVGGEDGSPIIALKRVIDRKLAARLNFLFIEFDARRFACLARLLEALKPRYSASASVGDVLPVHGDCVKELGAAIDRSTAAGVQFGPAMCFLDQFGYASVPIDLVRRIMSFPECEIMLYMDFRNINRFLKDESKDAARDATWGGTAWREARGKPEREQFEIVRRTYEEALRKHGRVRYAQSFAMWDKARPLSFLFFATNNLKGLKVMKAAMWRVDGTGEFLFSDAEAAMSDQGTLGLVTYGDAWLAQRLAERLSGKTMTWAQVEEYVLVETPCHNFKLALKDLELRQPTRLAVSGAPAGRKPGVYADSYCKSLRVTFLPGS
ncbi:MAG TPA: three-Cys-motif partner protein TcmP [Vicinamibacterales bacterium]|nr:three-Cys-motif partner protein TcmP [Vicinamibacterales bacterium]